MFSRQFYLKNDGQYGGLPGEDINVIPAWEMNLTGKGIPVVMYGNGCRMTHKEFEGRIDESMCWNYGTNSTDPYDVTGFVPDKTMQLTGLGMAGSNDFCGVGVAPEATIGCINHLNNTPEFTQWFNRAPKSLVRSMFGGVYCINIGGSMEMKCYASNVLQRLDDYFMIFNNISVIANSGGSGYVGQDAMFDIYSRSPYAYTFAQITQRGFRTFSSVEGSTLLASIPIGGYTGSSSTGGMVTLVSPSGESDDRCGLGVNPGQADNGIGAGAMAVLRQANPELKTEDLQAIIAITAVKNDPKSDTWVKNAAGYNYSRYYGFGRLDLGRAAKLAKEWKPLPEIKVETQQVVSGKKVQSFMKDPLTSTVKCEKMKFIEYIIFDTQFSQIDFGNVRVYLTSPMGTKVMLKNNQAIAKESLGTPAYRFATRQFFGENGVGEWTLTIQRVGYGADITFSGWVISFMGLEEPIELPKVEYKEGKDPFTPYDRNESITLKVNSPLEFKCDALLNISIDAPSDFVYPFDIVAKGENSNETMTVGSLTRGDGQIKMLCMFKSQKIQLTAISPVYNVSSNTVTIDYINNNKKEVVLPKPYEILEFPEDPSDDLKVTVFVHDNAENTKAHLINQVAIYSIVNADKPSVVYYHASNSFPGCVFNMRNTNITCEHCVLTVTPFNTNFEDKCDSYVIPISIVQHGKKNIDPWTLKWDTTCPPQSGILPDPTPTPIPTEPAPTEPAPTGPVPTKPVPTEPKPTPEPEKQDNRKMIIIITSSIGGTILIVIIVVLIIKCSRRKELNSFENDVMGEKLL
jgi:subtilisin-like proprotein convertase family protein